MARGCSGQSRRAAGQGAPRSAWRTRVPRAGLFAPSSGAGSLRRGSPAPVARPNAAQEARMNPEPASILVRAQGVEVARLGGELVLLDAQGTHVRGLNETA